MELMHKMPVSLFPAFCLEPRLCSTSLVCSQPYLQAMTADLTLGPPVCSLRSQLMEFTFMSFSLLTVPYAFTPSNCIFQLVALNCYEDILEDAKQVSLPEAWAVFPIPLTHTL